MIGAVAARLGAWWNAGLDVLDRWQRSWTPTAFLFGVVRKFLDDRGGQFGALIAYYGLLSIFPLMVMLLTVVSFAFGGDENLRRAIEELALSQFPTIAPTIAENTTALSGDTSTLVVGLLGTLWAGSAAMNAAGAALNAIFDVPRYRRPNPLERRVRGLAMVGVLGVGLLSSTIVAASSTVVADLPFLHALWLALAAIAINIAVYAVAFRTLVDAELSWSVVLPGAVLAGAAWWLLTKLGGIYVERTLSNASQTYGGIAGAVAILAWFYVQAQITILAAEVNIVLSRHLWPRSLSGRDLTPADIDAVRVHLETERLRPGFQVEVEADPSAVDADPPEVGPEAAGEAGAGAAGAGLDGAAVVAPEGNPGR